MISRSKKIILTVIIVLLLPILIPLAFLCTFGPLSILLDTIRYDNPFAEMQIEQMTTESIEPQLIPNTYKIKHFKNNKSGLKLIFDVIKNYTNEKKVVEVFDNYKVMVDYTYTNNDGFLICMYETSDMTQVPDPLITAYFTNCQYEGYFSYLETSSKNILKYYRWLTDISDSSSKIDTLSTSPVYNDTILFSDILTKDCNNYYEVCDSIVSIDYCSFNTDVLQQFLNVVFYCKQTDSCNLMNCFILENKRNGDYDCEVVYKDSFFTINILE